MTKNTDKATASAPETRMSSRKFKKHLESLRTIPAEKPTHSPLRWHIAEYGIRELKAKYLCIKHGSKTIARIDASGNSLSVTKQDEANAKLIVRCVNHAAQLSEALREARDFVDCLLANTPNEATDLLANHGEDVLHRIYNAIYAYEAAQ